MKYYICLEEDRIWYVRGRFKRCPGSGSHRRLEGLPLADVHGVVGQLGGEGVLEGGQVVGLPVQHRHLVALAEEGGRQVVPDALVGPGDQDGCHASVPLSWKNRWTWR